MLKKGVLSRYTVGRQVGRQKGDKRTTKRVQLEYKKTTG